MSSIHKPDAVTLTIDPPNGWHIVNGRMESRDQRKWQFPNWDIMIDTPTESGPIGPTKCSPSMASSTTWWFIRSGKEAGKRPALVSGIEKIVRAETADVGTAGI
jgi:hypothetical protein